MVKILITISDGHDDDTSITMMMLFSYTCKFTTFNSRPL